MTSINSSIRINLIRRLNVEIILDMYSTYFFSLLIIVSRCVIIWSYYYIIEESYYKRFISLVILFVISIVCLIFFRNIFIILIGWDGLGVTSFLLVIYYKNRKSLGSGMITALTNRLGDCFFLVLIPLIFIEPHSLIQSKFILVFILMILLRMTKSAQIPFSSWLPAAIAAPTPVRALVHSSTLVTAGVYILIRFNLNVMGPILIIGSITIIIAGLCACSEIDIKKVVALSTLSQLGVMIVSIGLNEKIYCFFHLLSHAIFKALLFICVGSMIHSLYGSQESRSYNNRMLGIIFPRIFLNIANLALIGFPFIAGFYRKDIILEIYFSNRKSYFIIIIFLVGVGLTAAYSVKLILFSIFSRRNNEPSIKSWGERGKFEKIPLSVLGTLSIVGGFMLSKILEPASPVIISPDKIIPLCIITLGVTLGWYITNKRNHILSSIWNLTPFFQSLADFSKKGVKVTKITDQGFVEIVGPNGLNRILITYSIPLLSMLFHITYVILLISLCWSFRSFRIK